MIKTVLFFAALSLTAAPLHACSTLKVKGFPDDCIYSPCGDGCDVFASDANGKWTVLPGVGEQLERVDGPAGTCASKLPVYFKTLANNRTLFMYFDASGGPQNKDEPSGWAIGLSIGSLCSDDRGQCSFGHIPSSCCTTGLPGTLSPNSDASYCEPFLMRQSEARVWRKDPRPLPQDAKGWWQIKAQPSCSCGCYAGNCGTCRETRWATRAENKGIKIKCASWPDRNAEVPELETQACPLGGPETTHAMFPTAMCRRDRCQGCCPYCNSAQFCNTGDHNWPDFYNPPIAECEHLQTSCGCDGANPVIDPAAM